MFAWSASELNDEQAAAVRSEGNVLLVACPGSGKTRTLTYKIAYELDRIASERQRVVAITYTHRAADEIRERIETLGVDSSSLWIGTIHSFCLEWIIKPYYIYEPRLANGYSVIDLHEREKLIEALCAPYRAQRVSLYDCDYYVTQSGVHLSCPDGGKHAVVRQVLAEYFRVLAQNRQIDFELLLWHAYSLLGRRSQICHLLSKIIPVVLVDEYQDTKEIQYQIIASIMRAGHGGTRLFMVGDPNQAIFGSLGGYAAPLHDLQAMIGLNVEPLELAQNYRSSERIIRYFSNFNVHGNRIEAASRDRDYPSLVTYDREVNHDELVGEIAALIRHNVDVLGIPPSQICVLAPQWPHLAAMTRRLVLQLPDLQFDGPGMVPFARDVENFWYKVARLALSDPSPAMYVRRIRWAGDVLGDLQHMGVGNVDLSRKALLRECNSINIDEQDGLSFLRLFFEQLFAKIGVDFMALRPLAEHHAAFFAGSAARIARLAQDGVAGVSDVTYFRKVFQNRGGVTVSTIHGVKGAEFDVVIAYALLEGMVPHFSDSDGATSARKMLYVVGSRARKNLHLFSEAGRNRGRFGVYSPTHALDACNFDYDQVV